MTSASQNNRNSDIQKALIFAEALAKSAGANLMTHFRNLERVSYKSDSSTVTIADVTTEKLIIDAINAEFPTDRILAEESQAVLATGQGAGNIWIIDPLDGTSNFANNYEYFCTSIARFEVTKEGQMIPQVGVIYDPCRDALYSAGRGLGASRNGKRIRIRESIQFEKAFLVTGFSYVKAQLLDAEIDKFRKVAQRCQTIRRDGAAALDLALVASGVFHCFWENNLSPWDVAAGGLLVKEAGGIVRNYTIQSEHWQVMNGSIIAGVPETVEELNTLLV
jgi:myo-inositol-1(or 4)-monophosphatase